MAISRQSLSPLSPQPHAGRPPPTHPPPQWLSSPDAGVVGGAPPGALATITGGAANLSTAATASQWTLSSDPRLPAAARGSVYALNLRAAGVPLPTSDAVDGAEGRFEVFVQGRRLSPARWPNRNVSAALRGYATLGNVSGDGLSFGWGPEADADQRPLRWTATPLARVRLHGYFHIGWADAVTALEAIVAANRSFQIPPGMHYMPPSRGERYFALNLVEELDAPGEFWYDVESATLLVYPPREAGAGWMSAVALSRVANPISLLPGSQFIRFTRLHVTAGRSQALVGAVDAHDITVTNCTFTAGAGVAVDFAASNSSAGPLTSYNNTVAGAQIYAMGAGGVKMDCGVRSTLQAGHCRIVNTVAANFSEWKYTYSFAAAVRGVGCLVANCDFSWSPHEAIQLVGNDHIVEYSRLHHLMLEAHDAGAIHQVRQTGGWEGARGRVEEMGGGRWLVCVSPGRRTDPRSHPCPFQGPRLDVPWQSRALQSL